MDMMGGRDSGRTRWVFFSVVQNLNTVFNKQESLLVCLVEKCGLDGTTSWDLMAGRDGWTW